MKNVSLFFIILFVIAVFSSAYAEITYLAPEPVREPMHMLFFGLGLLGIALAAKKSTSD